jgi:exodeoxyribonuclease V alpha subunit
LRLYNGDIGICLFDKELVKITVFFLRSNGSVKKVMPSRLNAAETVYAMTIHKAQGSEFEECLCVFPEETSSVLSKELIYTAVTRAKKSVKIFAKKTVFSFALQRKVERLGGLGKKLQI